MLNKFYDSIKNTKDDVIVGLELGIKMSAIQKQVERKVFKRFQVGGFRSLVKSAGLLKTLMCKLRVFERKKEPEEKELVQVTLKSASQVLNTHKSLEHFLIVRDLQEFIVAFVCTPNLYLKNQEKNRPSSPKDLSTIEMWKYYSPVGPPAIN